MTGAGAGANTAEGCASSTMTECPIPSMKVVARTALDVVTVGR